MAWGYWNATSLNDRGRSPRRDKEKISTYVSSESREPSQSREKPQQSNFQKSHTEPQVIYEHHRKSLSRATPTSVVQSYPPHGSTAGISLPAEIVQSCNDLKTPQPITTKSIDDPCRKMIQGGSFFSYSAMTRSKKPYHIPINIVSQSMCGLSASNYLPPSPKESDPADYEQPLPAKNRNNSLKINYHSDINDENKILPTSLNTVLLDDNVDDDLLSNADYDSSNEKSYTIEKGLEQARTNMCRIHGSMNFPDDHVSSLQSITTENSEKSQLWFDDISWVFPHVSAVPPPPMQGDDRTIYRRGARRWRKFYRINGHVFQAKRFNRRAFCAHCQDRIWGLGRQGFKCIQCKLLVHKKCHKVVYKPCQNLQHQSTFDDDTDDLFREQSQVFQGNMSMQCQQHRLYKMKSHDFPYKIRNTNETDCEKLASDAIRSAHALSDHRYSLNDFELLRVIGRGSYAKVFMVELKETKKIYAMKVIKKALVTDDEDIDWVQTEKHVFETATNHPFLVGLHSCFQTLSRLFFVIEFVRGGDLMFHMQRQKRLPEEHARFYAAEISLALNFLHQNGIIYRDLKLDNVLLDHEGHIKLTDYGMCKEGVREGDTTATFCGTPNYIAPEILRGEEYGFSVDWWALGVLLYEMMAGKSPFDVGGFCEGSNGNSEDYLFHVILHKGIRIPKALSVKAASVLKGFLNKYPDDRLGCSRGSNSFLDIIMHPFFKIIDWKMLEQKEIEPPYKPCVLSDRDVCNFPQEFTEESVKLTPDDLHAVEQIDQTEFEGFEYVNPGLMSLEDCV